MKKKSEKAVIAFYDDQGRILLQDRHAITETRAQWGFFGGGIELGETPEQALKREIKEELNFDLEEFEFLNNHKLILPDGKSYNKIWQFIGPLKDNLQKMVQKEGRSMKLFTLDEARKLTIYETDIDILKSIEEYIAKKIVR